MGLDLLAHSLMVVFYSIMHAQFKNIDIEMYQYLRDSFCTDGALARGIFMVSESFSKEKTLATIGFAFAIAGFTSTMLIYLCVYKRTRESLFNVCKPKSRNGYEGIQTERSNSHA